MARRFSSAVPRNPKQGAAAIILQEESSIQTGDVYHSIYPASVKMRGVDLQLPAEVNTHQCHRYVDQISARGLERKLEMGRLRRAPQKASIRCDSSDHSYRQHRVRYCRTTTID